MSLLLPSLSAAMSRSSWAKVGLPFGAIAAFAFALFTLTLWMLHEGHRPATVLTDSSYPATPSRPLFVTLQVGSVTPSTESPAPQTIVKTSSLAPMQQSLAVMTFVSACEHGPATTTPILRSVALWSAHSKAALPDATFVLALHRASLSAFLNEARLNSSHCDSALSPVRLNGSVATHMWVSPQLCPLQADLVLFLDDLLSPPLTSEEATAHRRHPWTPDGCFALWRDRVLVIHLLQLTSPFHGVLNLDSDVFICPQSVPRLVSHLAAVLSARQDSASILAPAPYGNGVVPYLPLKAVERNCGVIAFGSHSSSRALVKEWLSSMYKQLVCADCRMRQDQSAYREAVYVHYQHQPQREHIVNQTEFCRTEGSCASGCILVHRHDTQRGYLGDTAVPEGRRW